MEYKIYPVSNYNTQREIWLKKEVRGDINKITNEIKQDKSYHELLLSGDILKLNIDIDGCEGITPIIKDIIYILREELKLEITEKEIKYTENKKYGELHKNNLKSHHIVIPLYSASSNIMKEFWKYFEMKYKHKVDYGHLGNKGKLYRLPNQIKGVSKKLTKEEAVGTEHKIINGIEKDFILKHIEESKNIEELINKILNEEKKINNKIVEKEKTKIKIKINEEKSEERKETNIQDDEINAMLEKLDDKYLNTYEYWLKITTVLKTINKKRLWKEWSKKNNEKYDEVENESIWEGIKTRIDIGYLKYLTRDTYVAYKELPDISCDVVREKIESKYLSDKIDKEYLEKTKCLIIQSSVGTGKTYLTAEIIKSYLETKRIICIISKISLGKQHIKSFGDQQINLVEYTNKEKDIKKDNMVVCINSLRILSDLTDTEMEDIILYIDEVNSLIHDLVDNATLHSNLREIYHTLSRLIKNSYKIIATDAIITNNVLNLFKKIENKKIIINEYKKYSGVKAINVKDENLFLKRVLQSCEDGKPFLFGCDSKDIATKFYNECIKVVEKDKCVLITSETGIIVEDAVSQFKDKYVFYSPSIIFGVDFSIEESQDVFMYITQKSILPDGLFQQTCRTRNIKTLYYYCEYKERNAKYNSINDVYNKYKNIKNSDEALKTVCINYDEDEYVICNKSFFELYCYNAYVKDIYKTNIKKHYENILLKNGFVLEEEGDIIKIEKKKVISMSNEIKENNLMLINEYIEVIKQRNNSKEEIDIEFTETKNNKFENIKKRVKLLNLKKIKDVEKYKEILTNEKNILNHLNLINLIKSLEYINNKSQDEYKNAFDIKIYNSNMQKIKIIKVMEKEFNIHFTNMDFNTRECEIKMRDTLYKDICRLFRTNKEIPKNYKELLHMYVMMLKNVTGVRILELKKKRDNNTRNNIYILNVELLKYHYELETFSNPDKKNIDSKMLKFLKENKKSFFEFE